MKLDDLYGDQVIAVVREYNGLQPGLKGVVQGYFREEGKALVKFFNRKRTEEKIPLTHIIGLVYNGES